MRASLLLQQLLLAVVMQCALASQWGGQQQQLVSCRRSIAACNVQLQPRVELNKQSLLLPHTHTPQDSSYAAAMMDFSCRSDLVFYPRSTQEVAAHVATQLKAAAAAGTGLKVRVSHRCVRAGGSCNR
jgi:hypothetical protein